MLGLYLTTGSTYFYSAADTSIDCPTSINQRTNQKKIAIFGGSSANGYATPISFSKILCNYNFKNKNITVDNFSANGLPFSNYQSEIIKKVMNDYDIIVLYSGHNEMWTQVYRRNSSFVFPNGIEVVDPTKKIFSQVPSLNDNLGKLQTNKIIDVVIEKSRIYYFLFRVAQKIVSSITQDNSNKEISNKLYLKNPYYQNIFLTDFEKKNILDLYKKNVEEIINRLGVNQKLIISTVLSNDLFPPLADVIMGDVSDKSIDELNKQLKSIYKKLPDIDIQIVEEFISKAPETAHKNFLEGLLCLEMSDELNKTLDNNKCFSKLVKARGMDMFPNRVLPEINEYIRSIRHKNVIVIDPVLDMMKNITSINEYYDYFIDYQHPSILGHTLIAKNLLSALRPIKSITNSFNIDLCRVIWENSGSALSPKKICKEAYETNIRWLNVQRKIHSSFFLYDYYRSKSERNLIQVNESKN